MIIFSSLNKTQLHLIVYLVFINLGKDFKNLPLKRKFHIKLIFTQQYVTLPSYILAALLRKKGKIKIKV